MTGSAFIANRTIMRMIGHQPFNDLTAERFSCFVFYGKTNSVLNAFHAAHHQTTLFVVFVFKDFYGTLPACAYAAQRRMPAKVRQVETQCQTGFEQVFTGLY